MLIVVASVQVVVSPCAGAQTPVATGERVRVSGPRGDRFYGTLESVDPTSVVILGDSAVTVPTAALRSGDYRLARRSGTYGAEAALGTGVVFGSLMGVFAYCFQLFDEGCAKDTGAAFQGFGIGFGIGALVGGVIGSFVSEYEDVDPGALVERVQTTVAPHSTGDGWALALGLRLTY